MTTKPINRSFEDLDKVERLYELAFPSEERLEFSELLTLQDRADVEFVATYADRRFAGFTYVLRLDTHCWGFYFAVEPEMRGNGLGTEILVDVLRRNSDRLFVIDIESVDQPSDITGNPPTGLASRQMRQRRHEFYLRHGLRDSGVTREYNNVAYTIMQHGEGNITDEEYQTLIDTMWQTIDRHLKADDNS